MENYLRTERESEIKAADKVRDNLNSSNATDLAHCVLLLLILVVASSAPESCS